MKVELIGKNGFVATEAIKQYAEVRLQKIDQFIGENIISEARVVCKVYSDHHKVEVTIPTKNLILRAEVNDDDMYAAIDKAVDKLLTQIRRNKDKVKNKFEKEGIKGSFTNSQQFDMESLEKEVIASQLVKNKSIDLKPMTVDEAMTQMELLGHSFFIFLNKADEKVSVIYLREDGDYAIIETNN